MRFLKMCVLALASLGLLFAPAGAQVAQPAPSGLAGAGAGAGLSGAAVADYRFGIADKLRLTVYNEPTLSGEFTVGSNGMLSLPLVGDLAVKGKSTSEVIKMVTTMLSDGYLRDPRVSIDVLTYRPFFILGEVTKPGEYPYSNGLTVMNAVATASGFSYRASKKKVFIKRAGEAVEKRYDLVPDLEVQPGDTIRIAERYF
jgi:polysaccharide export outer membrane protein